MMQGNSMWTLSSLIVFYLTTSGFVQTREYYIEEGNIPSYMYHKFDYVEEYMFPSSITIKLSLSSVVGTLLYSMDRNNNQLIVTLRDDLHMDTRYGIQVELNSLFKVVSLSQLCTYEGSKFDVRAELTITIQITDLTTNYMTLMCDGGTPQWFLIKYEYKLDKNYPILPASWYSHPYSPNEAHMWIVNHPEMLSKYPNPYQMHGCIFGVFYNNKRIELFNASSNVGDKCKPSCTDDICNGGECHVFYSSEPLCNCTMAFRNGRLCNNSINPMNVESTNVRYYFRFLRLSWRSVEDRLIDISNTKLRIGLACKDGSLFFYYKFSNGQNKTKQVILTDQYVPNTESIFLAYHKDRNVEARVYNNKLWRVLHISLPVNVANEELTNLRLTSGKGVIEFVYKDYIERLWSTFEVTYSRDIDMVDPEKIASSKIIIEVSVIVPSIIFVVVIIIGIVIYRKYRYNKQKYPWLSDRRYINKCMNDIGWSTIDGPGSRKYWINFVKNKSQFQESRLNTLVDALIDVKQGGREYWKDIIVLFVHARIFVLPSMMAPSNDDIHNIYNNKSIKYFTRITRDKYYKLLFSRSYLLNSMIDFLVDASPYYRNNESIHSFVESVMIIMIRYMDYYGYNYDGHATLLEEYLCGDDYVALLAAVVLFVFVDRNKYLDKVRECLHREVSKEGNISEDTMMAYLRVIRRVAILGTKWTLSDIDYRLLKEIHNNNYDDPWRWYYGEYMDYYIIKIFVNNNKEGILQIFNEDSVLTVDQRSSIECLYLALRKVSKIYNDATTEIILPLLNELLSFVTNNNNNNNATATKMAENIIDYLCLYNGDTMINDIIDIFDKYYSNTRLNDDTKERLSKFITYNKDTSMHPSNVASDISDEYMDDA